VDHLYGLAFYELLIISGRPAEAMQGFCFLQAQTNLEGLSGAMRRNDAKLGSNKGCALTLPCHSAVALFSGCLHRLLLYRPATWHTQRMGHALQQAILFSVMISLSAITC
jgi:hypothetical protein